MLHFSLFYFFVLSPFFFPVIFSLLPSFLTSLSRYPLSARPPVSMVVPYENPSLWVTRGLLFCGELRRCASIPVSNTNDFGTGLLHTWTLSHTWPAFIVNSSSSISTDPEMTGFSSIGGTLEIPVNESSFSRTKTDQPPQFVRFQSPRHSKQALTCYTSRYNFIGEI